VGFRIFYTWNTNDKDAVLESELPVEQYQQIGFKLMARLGPFIKHKKTWIKYKSYLAASACSLIPNAETILRIVSKLGTRSPESAL